MLDDNRMKNTDADRAVLDRVMSVTADELRQFIERAEHLASEKRDVAEEEAIIDMYLVALGMR